MKEIKKCKDELARATYRWTGKVDTDEIQSTELTAVLIDNMGFEYGNRHGLAVFDSEGGRQLFDARYDSRFNTVETFYDNVLDFLKERYLQGEWELVSKS